MAKLTIIVEEKTEQLSDGHVVTGYATDVRFEPEGEEKSPLQTLVQPIYTAISYMMTALHGAEPCVARDLEPSESFSLEAEMAKEMANLEQPFPNEL